MTIEPLKYFKETKYGWKVVDVYFKYPYIEAEFRYPLSRYPGSDDEEPDIVKFSVNEFDLEKRVLDLAYAIDTFLAA